MFCGITPNLISIASGAFLECEVPFSTARLAFLLIIEVGSSIRTDTVLVAFMKNQSFWAFHALFLRRTPEVWRTTNDANI